ncbi:SDR family NAD(P)-dependent oxidoreductase [Flammeovirga kamogawensis]|uniref:SDR family NAD(P)-dependent oxidoreductase n=1 Tax=Flammeovirga kamogawensis TaxID=373891 RepID=A0ABX8GZ81_9BACT|nr:SDR family NAD(P)-dependent oxidoreductase [Flammeovirga kamogawensis]MBB6459088.1 NAD(P)-dependent dehydrogenase (short-subunit alcohol dehydrogenase family) [Flammeovirga kamogawensis]QWG08657.1 SDR family NAD(P)-dependent oxidoreductase [Flammeovirga kamogawensis]TRX66950.1 SDR family NAD(P)-dependent oxidoreductase [Flammeovirga kamogawensis]
MSNIFISGTSRGLGYGFAEYFLDKSDDVYGISRSSNDVLNAFDKFHYNEVDLTKLAEIESKVTAALEGVTKIQLVILNAGVLGKIESMEDASIEEMNEVLNVNLWANKLILDAIFKQGIKVNQVIAISSGASINGNKGWSGYSISKAALNMMVKLYAVEQTKTHFTALAPGLIDTTMQDYLCNVNSAEFPSVGRLKDARGTDAMPKPLEAAKHIADIFPALLLMPSGNYQDVRKL